MKKKILLLLFLVGLGEVKSSSATVAEFIADHSALGPNYRKLKRREKIWEIIINFTKVVGVACAGALLWLFFKGRSPFPQQQNLDGLSDGLGLPLDALGLSEAAEEESDEDLGGPQRTFRRLSAVLRVPFKQEESDEDEEVKGKEEIEKLKTETIQEADREELQDAETIIKTEEVIQQITGATSIESEIMRLSAQEIEQRGGVEEIIRGGSPKESVLKTVIEITGLSAQETEEKLKKAVEAQKKQRIEQIERAKKEAKKLKQERRSSMFHTQFLSSDEDQSSDEDVKGREENRQIEKREKIEEEESWERRKKAVEAQKKQRIEQIERAKKEQLKIKRERQKIQTEISEIRKQEIAAINKRIKETKEEEAAIRREKEKIQTEIMEEAQSAEEIEEQVKARKKAWKKIDEINRELFITGSISIFREGIEITTKSEKLREKEVLLGKIDEINRELREKTEPIKRVQGLIQSITDITHAAQSGDDDDEIIKLP